MSLQRNQEAIFIDNHIYFIVSCIYYKMHVLILHEEMHAHWKSWIKWTLNAGLKRCLSKKVLRIKQTKTKQKISLQGSARTKPYDNGQKWCCF